MQGTLYSLSQSAAVGRVQNPPLDQGSPEPIQEERVAPEEPQARAQPSEPQEDASTSESGLDPGTLRQLAGLATANEVMNQVLQQGEVVIGHMIALLRVLSWYLRSVLFLCLGRLGRRRAGTLQ